MTRALLLLIVSISLAHAEIWTGTAEISFSGTSTLHDWSGKVSAEPFEADVTVKNGQPHHVASIVNVKAADMDTSEEKRDENMHKAMKVTAHPLISGKINGKFKEIAPDGKPKSLPIELKILGKTHEIDGTISNWKLGADKATFDLGFPVSLKSCGIVVPKVLLVIKVGDTVNVKASVSLKRK